MESAEIRRRWLSFFEERGHTVVPSASLIADDPTLLLVPAGMVPFKPYFLGEVKPPYKRATSVQKCVRTPDIEEVGKTTRHGTFFQMCGNFSFGDYFKEGAAVYAWELLTTPQDKGGYGLDPERLWITVYEEDDEAERIWRDVVGVPAERIQRLGKADNYWDMGVPGPCGPCSEINYDRGPEFGPEGGPAVNDERYVELWNLVFMQYERGPGEGKDYPILGDLPSQNIDTGLGFERLAMVLQGVRNMYEIDTSRIVIDKATELTGVRYGDAEQSDVSLRVVADHIRTAIMLIGDGVTPGNEGRGYVLRRIMRRAIRNMRILGAAGADRRGARPTPSSRPWARSTRSWSRTASASRRSPSPRRPPSSRPCAPAPTSSTPPSPTPRRRGAPYCPARRRSCSTTPGASPSTSPWRWPPNRACPWTSRASAA